METRADVHLTQGDSSQNISADDDTGGREHECGIAALTENPIPENSYIFHVHADLATDTGDVTKKEQCAIPTCSQGHSNAQMAGNQINHKHDCRNSQDASNEVVLAATSEEVPLLDPAVPTSESRLSVNFDDSEAPTIIGSQEALLCSWSAPETNPHDDGERMTDLDDGLDPVQMLGTEAGRAYETDVPYREEETREDFDRPCPGLLSSQPPSSSPPQIFSSSPCVSSQSSVDDAEPSKMTNIKVENSDSAHDCSPYADGVEPAAQDKSHPASEYLCDQDIIDAIISTETAEHHSEMNPTPESESPGPSKKRVACQSDDDQSYGPQPTKRSKSGSHLYPPPTPMRATLASQSRQFKKLAAPFRPPSKLPVARDKPVQTTENVIEPAEQNHDKPDLMEPSKHVLRPQHKVSNTSRPVTQFKSPLMTRLPSADTRTIRLTPALQALERKLQLLKRAVKVKEDKEEEVLTRLAEKWTEAGREVAYEVWDATKDAGSFEEKAARRSYGWENTDNENASWGWDTKRDGEETPAPDPSMAVCGADPLAAEEEDEVSFHNTLGTMLRQLGIAPEIFGWDDDKEVFCN